MLTRGGCLLESFAASGPPQQGAAGCQRRLVRSRPRSCGDCLRPPRLSWREERRRVGVERRLDPERPVLTDEDRPRCDPLGVRDAERPLLCEPEECDRGAGEAGRRSRDGRLPPDGVRLPLPDRLPERLRLGV